jgi:hypothetical protein
MDDDMPDNSTPPLYRFDATLGEQAFRELRAEYDAISPNALSPINVDVITAASIAFAASPRVASLRERIAGELPRFDVTLVDKLPRYASTAWYATAVNLPVSAKPNEYDSLFEQATKKRELLLVAAAPLVYHNILDGDAIQSIRDGRGELDTITDLASLASLYDAQWAQIDGQSTVKRDDVDTARILSAQLFAYASMKIHGAQPTPISADQRQRAFTALDQAYGKIRRAVQYLLGDEADAIVPTLRPQGSRRTRDDNAAPTPSAEPSKPAAPPSTGAPIGDGSDPFKK